MKHSKNTLTRGDLKMAFVSDIHLSHATVDTTKIINTMERIFPKNAETAALDYIFLGGDVFDGLCLLPDSVVDDIQLWMRNLLKICSEFDIKLRILEGTPSHDRKQSQQFVTLNRCFDKPADLIYVDEVKVIHEEDDDIYILYVPDEWKHDLNETWDDVLEQLRLFGIDKVDVGVMHGMFDYQIPDNVPLPAHNAKNYLGIVKHFISIGHWHIASFFDRIFAQGTPERLHHGQPEAKGHVRATLNVDNPGLDTITFIENKNATIFETIAIHGLEANEASLKIEDVIKDFPDNSHVRIHGEQGPTTLGLFTAFKSIYPNLVWKLKTDKVKKKDDMVVVEGLSESKLVINNKTIVQQIKPFVDALDSERTEEILTFFKRTIIN